MPCHMASKQVVILAAVEGLFEGGAGIDRRRIDGGGQFRGQAHAVEVEREAVGEIHGGGGAEAGA